MTGIKLDHPEAAEQAFYQAFADADTAAMRRIWDEAADVMCAHPMGAAIRGVEPILHSFAQIFSAGPRLRFAIERVSLSISAELAVSVVYEHIHSGTAGKTHPRILATNVFRRRADGWHLLLHHAAPAVLGDAVEAPTQGMLH
jgi:ketosteroid isomerase-like protein